MKWILVVLIGGVTPLPTDLVFEKLSDCLAAEEQLRRAYADAFEAWNRRSSAAFDRFDRRTGRDYYRLRKLEAEKVSDTGTCIPHSGTKSTHHYAQQRSTPVSAPQPAPGAPGR